MLHYIVCIFAICCTCTLAIVAPIESCQSDLDCGVNRQCCRLPSTPQTNPINSRRAAHSSAFRSLRQLIGPCVVLCPPEGCPPGQICTGSCPRECTPAASSIAVCLPYLEEGRPCLETCGCASGLTCDFNSPPDLPISPPIPVGTCRACTK